MKTHILDTSLQIVDRALVPGRPRNNENFVESSIPTEGVIRHQNYAEYLSTCWASHAGVVLTPQAVWFTILGELTIHIKNNAEKYNHLFSGKPYGEKSPLLQMGRIENMDPIEFTRMIKELAPMDTSPFLPEFSTENHMYDVASNLMFCDAMSPYYSYMMYLCGISKIRVEGTEDDWRAIQNSMNYVGSLLGLDDAYVSRVCLAVEKIIHSNDTMYWKEMFQMERCGSGSQHTVTGWFLDFLMNTKQKEMLNNFPPHVAKIDVKHLTTDKMYECFAGCFYSTFDGEYLTPHFAKYTKEKIEPVTKSLDDMKIVRTKIERPSVKMEFAPTTRHQRKKTEDIK